MFIAYKFAAMKQQRGNKSHIGILEGGFSLMKHCKRIILFFLVLCLFLGILAGCSTPDPSPTEPLQGPVKPAEPAQTSDSDASEPPPVEEAALDNELQRAQEASFIMDGWLEDMDAAVTFQEYSSVTIRFVELWKESRLDEWKETVKLASQDTGEMAREDGFLMLSYLWVLMGYNHDDVDCPLDSEVDIELDFWSMTSEESQMRQLSWDYPCFPDALDDVVIYDVFNANYMWGAVMSFPLVFSPISGKPMFEWDQNYSLRLQDPLTRDEAVRAIVRMAEYCQVELDPDWRDYISIDEVGTYDKGIITDALLNQESDLPEVEQQKLPSAWKGSGLGLAKGNTSTTYMHFREGDIRFLSENGFNFTRLFFDFGSLRYPDYPEDWRQVNRSELEELDQLLAWCIQYGVHLQISMEWYQDVNGNGKHDATMPLSEEEWAVTRAYWEMLAKRYAGIPSKYLSFDLCNEIEPLDSEQPDDLDFDTAIEGIASVRDAIWNADPDRVLLYSFQDSPPERSVDAIAALGLAIGCHCYKPYILATVSWEYLDTNPYAEPIHPQPVFPIAQISSGQAPLTITGAVSGVKLSFHFWTSDGGVSVEILADGEMVETVPLDGGRLGDDGAYYFDDVLYSVDIPEGTKEITLWVRDGGARLDTIIIEGNGPKVTMMPSDTCDYLDWSDPLPLVVNNDGTYTNSENKVFDADLIYEISVKPYRDIAEKHGVGFMINEFGCFGTLAHWNIDTVNAYHEEVLTMLEKYNLGWCYCETYNSFPKHFIIVYGNHSQWAGATVEEITYDFGDHTETLKVCKELLQVFRDHTLGK